MRRLYFILLFSYTLDAFAWHWQDLWATRDQQGARYLQKQSYQKAQETFERPEWRATAAYRAKNFDTASQTFGQLNTAEGYYNQGNAEAHLGHYQEALEAYKKSLKLRPQDPDTLHNKKIIEALLKKQKSQSQSPEQNEDSSSKKEPSQNIPQPKDTQNQNAEKQGAEKNQASQEQTQNNEEKHSEQNTPPKQEEPPPEAAQNDNTHTENNQDTKASNIPEEKEQTTAAATSEKDQATEQLLNMIPDDPSGLLRQKFLRDHRRRANGETS